MKDSLRKRIYSSVNAIKLNNLKMNLKLEFLNDLDIKKLPSITTNYTKKISKIDKNNYDVDIIKKYNDSIKKVLDDNLNIMSFVDETFYGENIISPFISSRIIRDIINNLTVKTEYNADNRQIIIFSKNELDGNLIKEIDSIFNFFDFLLGKSNYYKLEVFLSKKKKLINPISNSLNPDNINSGATLPGSYIYIFRKEELVKVLFHELVHYLNLDMKDHQMKFMKLYEKINLKATMINPNEAYTEILALLFMNIWRYGLLNEKDILLKEYLDKVLILELGWSYHQIAKILKFFKCYKNYDDLFTHDCEFRQKSNVLDYYLLKTYFLQNINVVLKDFRLHDIFVNKEKTDNILKITNLENNEFSNNINNVINTYDDDNLNLDHISMRMSCL